MSKNVKIGTLDDISISFKNIWGFEIVEVDGEQKIQPPKAIMPEYVKERVRFFTKYRENGMTFYGCLNCILAYDEEQQKKDFDFGAYEDWFPVTQEFKEWRDLCLTDRAGEIAVAILYGTCEEDDE